jgi:formate dehydrogenase family accessory protein FdhD
MQVTHITIKKISVSGLAETDDELAVEQPLEIRLAYQGEGGYVQQKMAVTMRTPGNDEELAAGFLYTEGIIAHRKMIRQIDVTDHHVVFTLKDGSVPVLEGVHRNFPATASCGVCGKTDIESIYNKPVHGPSSNDILLPATLFYTLQKTLEHQQVLFEHTGGLHAAALFDFDGDCHLLREDIGRHNALDKVIGHAFLNERLPLQKSILLLSGRAGFELIQKAYMAGIPVIAAVGAPSSMAVERAKDCGITLIGFLREERFNVYTGWERIQS